MKTLCCDGCGTSIERGKLTLSIPEEDWEVVVHRTYKWVDLDFCELCAREIFVNMRTVVARLKEQRT